MKRAWSVPSAARRGRAFLRQSPSRALLMAQALAVVLYPFAAESRWGHLFASLISVGVLSFAIQMVRRSPRQAWLAAAFAILGVALWQVHAGTDSVVAGVIGAGFYAAAYIYSAVALISYMMMDEQTTTDELWAAGATFMLLVEAFAWIFMAWQLVQPGAFGLDPEGSAIDRRWMQLLFLSSSNFSATGLSDVYPATAHARMLVLLEQWCGVMYLAIVVARLSGMLRKGRIPMGTGPDR